MGKIFNINAGFTQKVCVTATNQPLILRHFFARESVFLHPAEALLLCLVARARTLAGRTLRRLYTQLRC